MKKCKCEKIPSGALWKDTEIPELYLCPVCEGTATIDEIGKKQVYISTEEGELIQKILQEVEAVINGERQDQYGSPEDSFEIIAEFWDTYLKYRPPGPIVKLDVSHMMSLFKHARMLGQKPKRDNYVDAIGYLAIAADRLLSHEE